MTPFFRKNGPSVDARNCEGAPDDCARMTEETKALDKRAIYRKTDKGVAEITGSERTVDRRLRPLLILVDGNRTATYIHSLIGGIGIREEDFDHLISGGFIEAISLPNMAPAANDADATAAQGAAAAPPASVLQRRGSVDRYCDGKRYLSETAADRLGLKSFFFQLKLEKTSTSEDLLALLPEFEEALARKVHDDYARHCRRIAESLLKA
jgi:hypothetical protein